MLFTDREAKLIKMWKVFSLVRVHRFSHDVLARMFHLPQIGLEVHRQSLKGKWSLGLLPFGLKSFGLIQLVTWLNFLKLSVSGIGHLA